MVEMTLFALLATEVLLTLESMQKINVRLAIRRTRSTKKTLMKWDTTHSISPSSNLMDILIMAIMIALVEMDINLEVEAIILHIVQVVF
jgi:uncharacterized membrane protein YbaN (DUF454 family)